MPLANCETNQGTIKLSPGLTETPHVQTITIKGTLGGCDGPSGVEAASYVEHLKTTEEVTCSALQSFSFEPTTVPVSLTVKWPPKELGSSHGTMVLPITEASSAALTGALEGGPFGGPEPITGGEVFESFTGGPSCGLAEGKKTAKPVKRARSPARRSTSANRCRDRRLGGACPAAPQPAAALSAAGFSVRSNARLYAGRSASRAMYEPQVLGQLIGASRCGR